MDCRLADVTTCRRYLKHNIEYIMMAYADVYFNIFKSNIFSSHRSIPQKIVYKNNCRPESSTICFVTEGCWGWGWCCCCGGKIHIFCNNLDLVHRIQTKFGMDILLDPRNKLVEEFFIFLKIQDGRRRSKIEFRHNFGSKFTFRLGKWIPFIRFGQNLAGRYYSTLGTSLRNNFCPIAKSKMAAAAAITAKY